MTTTTTKAPVTCYGRIVTRNVVQEWYETESRHAGMRTRELKKLGYRAVSSAMGSQVTPVGYVKMTLVTITAEDTTEVPEPARIERQ